MQDRDSARTHPSRAQGHPQRLRQHHHHTRRGTKYMTTAINRYHLRTQTPRYKSINSSSNALEYTTTDASQRLLSCIACKTISSLMPQYILGPRHLCIPAGSILSPNSSSLKHLPPAATLSSPSINQIQVTTPTATARTGPKIKIVFIIHYRVLTQTLRATRTATPVAWVAEPLVWVGHTALGSRRDRKTGGHGIVMEMTILPLRV